MKKGINIEQQLKKEQVIPTQEQLHEFVSTIWNTEHLKEIALLERLINKATYQTPNNHFNIDVLSTENIYHISDIKKICIDYRLRFLPSYYFKGDIPFEAISKIKALEHKHKTAFYNFKIMAPSKLFKLKKADDPLLFIPINDNYYYLVHQWGNDLHPLRKAWSWCFKSFENLIFVCFLVSILLTLLIPEGLFSPAHNPSIGFVLEILFMFKAVVAVALYYGFAKGKNFNTVIWNNKRE